MMDEESVKTIAQERETRAARSGGSTAHHSSQSSPALPKPTGPTVGGVQGVQAEPQRPMEWMQQPMQPSSGVSSQASSGSSGVSSTSQQQQIAQELAEEMTDNDVFDVRMKAALLSAAGPRVFALQKHPSGGRMMKCFLCAKFDNLGLPTHIGQPEHKKFVSWCTDEDGVENLVANGYLQTQLREAKIPISSLKCATDILHAKTASSKPKCPSQLEHEGPNRYLTCPSQVEHEGPSHCTSSPKCHSQVEHEYI
jgi:hypothetical protein